MGRCHSFSGQSAILQISTDCFLPILDLQTFCINDFFLGFTQYVSLLGVNYLIHDAHFVLEISGLLHCTKEEGRCCCPRWENGAKTGGLVLTDGERNKKQMQKSLHVNPPQKRLHRKCHPNFHKTLTNNAVLLKADLQLSRPNQRPLFGNRAASFKHACGF